jgi:hypothetical protein
MLPVGDNISRLVFTDAESMSLHFDQLEIMVRFGLLSKRYYLFSKVSFIIRYSFCIAWSLPLLKPTISRFDPNFLPISKYLLNVVYREETITKTVHQRNLLLFRCFDPSFSGASKVAISQWNNSFTCIDQSQLIPLSVLNDGKYDCRDSSCELCTSACIHGHFDCPNVGFYCTKQTMGSAIVAIAWMSSTTRMHNVRPSVLILFHCRQHH